MERTLGLIKPDAVAARQIGEIVKMYEDSGLNIVAMKMVRLTPEEAGGFYAVHRERPFFDSLVEFMSSGPFIALVLEGENAIQRNRDLMGATDPSKAEQGTIRARFGSSIQNNAVHGSDAPETARFEISYFFGALEIVA